MKYIVTPLCIFFSLFLSAQTETDVVKKMSVRACDCGNKLNMQEISSEELTSQIGMCILNAYSENKEEYERVTNKNSSISPADFEQLAEEIGFGMLDECPDLVMSLGVLIGDDETDDVDLRTATGKIIKLEKNQFYNIVFETDSGEIIKILYLFEVDGANIIFNEKLWTEPITIGYGREELFSAQTDSPSNFNILYYIE